MLDINQLRWQVDPVQGPWAICVQCQGRVIVVMTVVGDGFEIEPICTKCKEKYGPVE